MNETVVFRNELGGYSTPYDKDTLARLYYELQKENEHLTAENASLRARLSKAVELPFIHKFHIKDIKGNAVTLYQLVYIGDDNSITTEIENSEERAKARLAVLEGGEQK